MPAPKNDNPQPAPKRRRGAPRGNLNALKSGRHSRQLKLLVQRFLADPDLLRGVLAFSRSQPFHDQRTREAVNELVNKRRRSNAQRLRDANRDYKWLPYFDDGEAPW